MNAQSRLPFFYGWVIVAITFVTMAIGVNVRTAFSLFFPPILSEFGWERGVTAGAFSFGFFVSAFISPLIGRLMDRAGPRVVIELGVLLMSLGLLLAPLTREPWHLYVTIGFMVGAGSNCLGYYGQSLFLPNWFVRTRGLAIGIAFAGVGIGSVTLLPWVQYTVDHSGWRTACTAMGILSLIVLVPINLLLRKRPEDIGLLPDGGSTATQAQTKPVSNLVDPVWAATDWTLARALRTARFWFIALGYASGLYVWYAVQVHQTQYLKDIGFSSQVGVWALGVVSLLGIPGQIVLGHMSDSRRARGDLGDCVSRLRHLFRGADRASISSQSLAGLSDGVRPRRARLWPHLGDGRDRAGDFSRQALRRDLRLHHVLGHDGRRRGAVAHRRAA